MKSEPTLVVSKIRNGTVIDHIPAGRALEILSVLGIDVKNGPRIAVIMNVESKKLGKKDIIKIEDWRLTPEEVNVIALLAPLATINIIEDFAVVVKYKVVVPERIEGVVKCPNPTCITNKKGEPLRTKFRVVIKEPLRLQCEYCGTLVSSEEIRDLIVTKGVPSG